MTVVLAALCLVTAGVAAPLPQDREGRIFKVFPQIRLNITPSIVSLPQIASLGQAISVTTIDVPNIKPNLGK